MLKPIMTVILAPALLAAAASAALAAEGPTRASLQRFNVTIRVFDLSKSRDSGTDYVLPVDSPDAEHAAASTMANAISFTKKIEAGKPLPLAFTCIKIEPR